MLAAGGPDRPLNFPLAPNKLPFGTLLQLMETQELLLMELMWQKPRSRRGAAGALIQTPPM
jgi:hypothetical protein